MFLPHTEVCLRPMIPDIYGLFPFEPFQSLHLGISKALYQTVITHLCSNTISAILGHTTKKWNPVIRAGEVVLRGAMPV